MVQESPPELKEGLSFGLTADGFCLKATYWLAANQFATLNPTGSIS